MTKEEFLDKYNCEMNSSQISEIKDTKIQEIKKKYWDLKHKAFLDERNIRDWELGGVLDEYTLLERKELEEYYQEMQENTTKSPKDLIIEQETEMMNNMTEGQLAEYIATNFNDF